MEAIGLTIAALAIIVAFAVSSYIGSLRISLLLFKHRIQDWKLYVSWVLKESDYTTSTWHANWWVYRHERDK
jgi:hypothetical protein